MVFSSGRQRKKNKEKSAQLYEKLSDLVQSGGAELPPIINLYNDEAYDIWVLWQATGKRFLPSQLLNEPESLMADILQLDSVFETMKEKYDGSKDN